jgi:hypothetical protein
MAVNPSTEYAGRITAPDANFPYGSSQDQTAPGANDGTPYNKKRADDIFGFQQKLLNAASIAPENIADNVTKSQYFEAMNKVRDLAAGVTYYASVSGSGDFSGVDTSNRMRAVDIFGSGSTAPDDQLPYDISGGNTQFAQQSVKISLAPGDYSANNIVLVGANLSLELEGVTTLGGVYLYSSYLALNSKGYALTLDNIFEIDGSNIILKSGGANVTFNGLSGLAIDVLNGSTFNANFLDETGGVTKGQLLCGTNDIAASFGSSLIFENSSLITHGGAYGQYNSTIFMGGSNVDITVLDGGAKHVQISHNSVYAIGPTGTYDASANTRQITLNDGCRMVVVPGTATVNISPSSFTLGRGCSVEWPNHAFAITVGTLTVDRNSSVLLGGGSVVNGTVSIFKNSNVDGYGVMTATNVSVQEGGIYGGGDEISTNAPTLGIFGAYTTSNFGSHSNFPA